MKSYYIFKGTLILTFFLVSFTLKAQEQNGITYNIIDNGSVSNIEPYINALNNANMRYHRLKNARHTITFDTGVSVQLFSATELIANGIKINLADYPESFSSSREEPKFSLGQNNIILEPHKHGNK